MKLKFIKFMSDSYLNSMNVVMYAGRNTNSVVLRPENIRGDLVGQEKVFDTKFAADDWYDHQGTFSGLSRLSRAIELLSPEEC